MLTYMTHEKHGVHIAYTEQEIKICESNGWKVYGPTPPGSVDATPQDPKPIEPVKAKRKYVRKAA